MSFEFEPWIWWAVAAVILLVVELATPGMFVFACLSVAALITAGASYLGLGGVALWVVFMVSALALVVQARAVFSRFLEGELHPSNVDEVLGKEALVLQPISPHAPGTVKVGGESWRARSQQEHKAGDVVVVTAVDGNHLVVQRKES